MWEVVGVFGRWWTGVVDCVGYVGGRIGSWWFWYSYSFYLLSFSF